MNAKRLYIYAAIFLFLSSVKYFAPEYSAVLREKISELAEGDENYGEKVTAIGKKLYTGELKDELVQAFKVNETEKSANEMLPENVLPGKQDLPFEYCRPVSATDFQSFGYREHTAAGNDIFHYGVDFPAENGTEVLAFADGIVSATGTNDSLGNYLIIQHADGYKSLYAHLLDCAVNEGCQVGKGELIAYVGQSGKATASQLHFELTFNGFYMNPGYYI